LAAGVTANSVAKQLESDLTANQNYCLPDVSKDDRHGVKLGTADRRRKTTILWCSLTIVVPLSFHPRRRQPPGLSRNQLISSSIRIINGKNRQWFTALICLKSERKADISKTLNVLKPKLEIKR